MTSLGESGTPLREDHPPLVLLVEDDPETRQMYALFLDLSGFRLAEAHNGFQALDKAMTLLPDVVVTDLALPGLDGFELCQRLKRDDHTCGIPVIALTGHATLAEQPQRAVDAGCESVLIKPCPPDELRDEILHVLQQRKAEPDQSNDLRERPERVQRRTLLIRDRLFRAL